MSTRLFKWDIQNNSLTDYFNLNVQGITTLVTATGHGGSSTQVIQYAPTSTGSTNGDTVIRQPLTFNGTGDNDVAWTSNKTELYLSWWQHFPNVQDGGGAGGHGWRLHPAGDNTVGLDSQTFDNPSPGGTFGWGLAVFDNGLGYAVEPPTVWTWNLNAWNHFEMYVKLNAANTSTDILTFWINGSQTFNNTHAQLRSGSTDIPTGYGEFALFTNFDPGAPHAGGTCTWLVQDIEIWDGMPDTPVLANPNAGTPTTVGTNGANVSSDTALGTLYWAISQSPYTVTFPQVTSGTGGNVVAGMSSSQAVTSTGTQTIINVTGGNPATIYQLNFAQYDGTNNSNLSSVQFTTSALSIMAAYRGNRSLR